MQMRKAELLSVSKLLHSMKTPNENHKNWVEEGDSEEAGNKRGRNPKN